MQWFCRLTTQLRNHFNRSALLFIFSIFNAYAGGTPDLNNIDLRNCDDACLLSHANEGIKDYSEMLKKVDNDKDTAKINDREAYEKITKELIALNSKPSSITNNDIHKAEEQYFNIGKIQKMLSTLIVADTTLDTLSERINPQAHPNKFVAQRATIKLLKDKSDVLIAVPKNIQA